ncbi:Cypemycin methyltransferase [Rosistilla ulvae]|uniref:Cypemycin methyltransferase n=1 Tax=Rosistilla ulvae TaxID=1930277 RepID=A0A517M472_9BACT|nr:class I SAM-dependent methyltransferase [Rosistilla ulvae]QDS89667.1 Cypemycin methyltransferase [Rosistilla ulvae]
MQIESIPSWQLPAGVSPGTWDYAARPAIATEYDQYFADHPLFALDQQLVLQHLPPPDSQGRATVADLGCGTGRALVALAASGYRGLAIDLSQHMLEVVQQKAQTQALPIASVRANLVDLNGIADNCVEHAVSLFSTLGMIRGRANRIAALAHTRRILKPGGKFVLHVHNIWSSLYDPAGLRWLCRSWWSGRKRGDQEFGDRVYQYRGLPNMFLHNFGLSELKADLRQAGFQIEQIFPLNLTASGVLPLRRVLPRVRAGGFVAVCRRD